VHGLSKQRSAVSTGSADQYTATCGWCYSPCCGSLLLAPLAVHVRVGGDGVAHIFTAFVRVCFSCTVYFVFQHSKYVKSGDKSDVSGDTVFFLGLPGHMLNFFVASFIKPVDAGKRFFR
jgi:hypothetical protein